MSLSMTHVILNNILAQAVCHINDRHISEQRQSRSASEFLRLNESEKDLCKMCSTGISMDTAGMPYAVLNPSGDVEGHSRPAAV